MVEKESPDARPTPPDGGGERRWCVASGRAFERTRAPGWSRAALPHVPRRRSTLGSVFPREIDVRRRLAAAGHPGNDAAPGSPETLVPHTFVRAVDFPACVIVRRFAQLRESILPSRADLAVTASAAPVVTAHARCVGEETIHASRGKPAPNTLRCEAASPARTVHRPQPRCSSPRPRMLPRVAGDGF